MATAETIVRALRTAVAAKTTERGERNAAVRVLARYGFVDQPTLETGRLPSGKAVRVYKWDDIGDDGKTVLLVTGPSIEGEVRLESDADWDDAPQGAYVPMVEATKSASRRLLSGTKRLAQREAKLWETRETAVKQKRRRRPKPAPPVERPGMKYAVAGRTGGEVIPFRARPEDDGAARYAPSRGMAYEVPRVSGGPRRRARPEITGDFTYTSPQPELDEAQVAQQLFEDLLPPESPYFAANLQENARDVTAEEGWAVAADQGYTGDLHTFTQKHWPTIEAQVQQRVVAKLAATPPAPVLPGKKDPVVHGTVTVLRRQKGPFRAPHYSIRPSGVITEAHAAVGGTLYLDELYAYTDEQIANLEDALKILHGTVRIGVQPKNTVPTPERKRFQAYIERIRKASGPLRSTPDDVITMLKDARVAAVAGDTRLADDLRRMAGKLYKVMPKKPSSTDFHHAFNDVGEALSQTYAQNELQRAEEAIRTKGGFRYRDIGLAYLTPSSGGAFLQADVPPTGRQKKRRVYYGVPLATKEEAIAQLEGYLDLLAKGEKREVLKQIRSEWEEEKFTGRARFSAARDKLVREAAKLVQEAPMVSERDIRNAEMEGRKYAEPNLQGFRSSEEEAETQADLWYGPDSGPEGTPSPVLREAFMRGWNEGYAVFRQLNAKLQEYITDNQPFLREDYADWGDQALDEEEARLERIKRFALDLPLEQSRSTNELAEQVENLMSKLLLRVEEGRRYKKDADADVDRAKEEGYDLGREVGPASETQIRRDAEATFSHPDEIAAFIEGYAEALERFKRWAYPPKGENNSIEMAWEGVTGGNRDVLDWPLWDGREMRSSYVSHRDVLDEIFAAVADETPYMDAGTADIDKTRDWLIKVTPEKYHTRIVELHDIYQTKVRDKISDAIAEDLAEAFADWEKVQEPAVTTVGLREFEDARRSGDTDRFIVISEQLQDAWNHLPDMEIDVSGVPKGYEGQARTRLKTMIRDHLKELIDAHNFARQALALEDEVPFIGADHSQAETFSPLFGLGSGSPPRPTWNDRLRTKKQPVKATTQVVKKGSTIAPVWAVQLSVGPTKNGQQLTADVAEFSEEDAAHRFEDDFRTGKIPAVQQHDKLRAIAKLACAPDRHCPQVLHDRLSRWQVSEGIHPVTGKRLTLDAINRLYAEGGNIDVWVAMFTPKTPVTAKVEPEPFRVRQVGAVSSYVAVVVDFKVYGVRYTGETRPLDLNLYPKITKTLVADIVKTGFIKRADGTGKKVTAAARIAIEKGVKKALVMFQKGKTWSGAPLGPDAPQPAKRQRAPEQSLKEIADANFYNAVDQAPGQYAGDYDQAFKSYADNVFDTAMEQGYTESQAQQTVRIYNALVDDFWRSAEGAKIRQLERDRSWLEDHADKEGIEATDLEGKIEMASFDLGYQTERLPGALIRLGEAHGIDAAAEHRKGMTAREAEEYVDPDMQEVRLGEDGGDYTIGRPSGDGSYLARIRSAEGFTTDLSIGPDTTPKQAAERINRKLEVLDTASGQEAVLTVAKILVDRFPQLSWDRVQREMARTKATPEGFAARFQADLRRALMGE